MARFDSMRKLERNRLLLQYVREHPDLSQGEIGKVFNISRQRVCEILQNDKKKLQLVS